MSRAAASIARFNIRPFSFPGVAACLSQLSQGPAIPGHAAGFSTDAWQDRIHLKGARFWGYHGALPEENRLGQPFEVDATVFCSLRPAGETDDLHKTINYADVYRLIEKTVTGPPHQLLESVAETICRQVLQGHTSVGAVQVYIRKLSIPAVPSMVQSIGIEVMRTRQDYS